MCAAVRFRGCLYEVKTGEQDGNGIVIVD